jgi:hypothetical protein
MTLLNQSLSTSPQNNLKEIQIYQSKILSKEVPSPAQESSTEMPH